MLSFSTTHRELKKTQTTRPSPRSHHLFCRPNPQHCRNEPGYTPASVWRIHPFHPKAEVLVKGRSGQITEARVNLTGSQSSMQMQQGPQSRKRALTPGEAREGGALLPRRAMPEGPPPTPTGLASLEPGALVSKGTPRDQGQPWTASDVALSEPCDFSAGWA